MITFFFQCQLVVIVCMVFQRQVVELRRLGAQLDNMAEKINAAARDRHHPQHEWLTERAVALQQKAADYETVVESHIDSWNSFNQNFEDVCAILDDIKNRLPPTSPDLTSDVSLLSQQVSVN